MKNKELYKVVLLLGSNLPLGKMSPAMIIEEADKEIIDALLPDYLEVGSLEEAASATEIVETEPCGKFEEENPPKFFNQVLSCITDKEPMDVLKETQRIERLFGRMRTYKEKGKVYQSRTLDIDILKAYKCPPADSTPDKKADNVADKMAQWVEIESNIPELILPHPQIETRPFVKSLIEGADKKQKQ